MIFWYSFLPYLPFLVLAAAVVVATHHVHFYW